MGETDFGWDDEVGLQRAICLVWSLRRNKKTNEAKEKKEREPQVDPTEPKVVEAVDTNQLAQMVGDIVNQKIENVADRISQQGDKIGEMLVKAIEEQRLKMQGEVIESILIFF